jgi:cellulose synthase operon protein C
MIARRRLVVVGLLLAASCAHLQPHGATVEGAGERGWRAWLAGDSSGAERAFATVATTTTADDARALYGRALLFHERGDWAHAWDAWWTLLDAATRAPQTGRDATWWHAFADSAAHKLEGLVGEVAGERAQAEKLALLDGKRLPLDARLRLLAMRATYARRLGREDEARGFDAARGCPGHWYVAGSYGRLPRLDLETSFAPDGDGDRARLRDERVRGCNFAIDADGGLQGVLYAAGWMRAGNATDAVVTVEDDEPWRLYVDGKPAFDARDATKYTPRIRRVTLPLAAGWHHVALKMSGPGGRADVAFSVAADAPLEFHDGPASSAPRASSSSAPRASSSSAPRAQSSGAIVAREISGELPDAADANATDAALIDFLAAQAASRLGDTDGAEAALARLATRAPKFAPAELVAANVYANDASRPQRTARDRSRRALERALKLDGTLERARYNLALTLLNNDKVREALATLDDARAGGAFRKSWQEAFGRYQALKQRGWQREAELALDDARKIDPEACQPLAAAVELARDRHDVALAAKLAQKASTCNGGSDELADLLRNSGQLDGAIAEYRRLVALDPAKETWRAGLAEALKESSQPARAVPELETLILRHPRAAYYRRSLADVLFELGQAERARKVIEDGLALTPENQELSRALLALCPESEGRCPGILDPFRVDGRSVIAAYEHDAQKPKWATPAVIVLDRTVTRVFPTGGRLTLTHNIIQVLDKDGIDKWGEVSIPGAADVLTLRTVKADGTTREPEDLTGDKDTISVPDLEPGDYVEFEYVDPQAPPAAFPDGFLAERFFFGSYDAPLYRSEYVVAAPEDMKLQIDRRGNAPKEMMQRQGALETYTFGTRYCAQLHAEPAAAPMAEYLPSVRVAANLSVAAWSSYLFDAQWPVNRANLELTTIVARETKNARSPVDKVRALDAWVRKHIKQGGTLDEAATSILAREEGSRVALLSALLSAAGVPSEMWLVRAARDARLDGELPDLEGYDEPILSAAGLLVDPRFRHGPAGQLSPALRGGTAMVLGLGKPRLVPVPKQDVDARRMELDVQLAADGGAEVSVREELRGWPALEWREALEKLAPDRVYPEFEQRTLGYYFPGAVLSALDWSGKDDDAGAFVVSYKFKMAQLARRAGRELILPAPFPAQLARRYLGATARTTPLMVEYGSPTKLHARITLPPRAVAVLPPPVSRNLPYAHFSQAATGGDGVVELDASFAMDDARLPVSAFPAFADFALTVDRAEVKALTIRLQ